MGLTTDDYRSIRWHFLQTLRQWPRESVTILCERLGLSRSTAYKWKRRFCVSGETQARSRRPKRSGAGLQAKWQEEVLALQERHGCGADQLRWYLRRAHGRVAVPSVRTIHRWLVSAGRVRRRKRRAPVGPQVQGVAKRVARGPNWIWAMDFKGGFCTRDGRLVNTLTITDVYSHFILALDTVTALSAKEVQRRLRRIFRCYGLPRVIRVDHGAPWYGPGTRGWTQLSVWLIRLGIAVEYIGRNGNASHEQMHRMLKARTATPPAQNIRAQRARYAWWKKHYNHERPHQGAGDMPPAECYRPSAWHLPAKLPVLKASASGETITVNPYGYSYWHKAQRSVGRAFANQHVQLRKISPLRTAVYFGPHLLGTLQTDESALRPVALNVPT